MDAACLTELLEALETELRCLHPLVDLLKVHVWDPLMSSRFNALPGRDLTPLLEALESEGWAVLARAVEEKMDAKAQKNVSRQRPPGRRQLRIEAPPALMNLGARNGDDSRALDIASRVGRLDFRDSTGEMEPPNFFEESYMVGDYSRSRVASPIRSRQASPGALYRFY